MTAIDEKRKYTRIPANELPASLILRDGLDGPVLVGPEFGALSDISASGSKVTTLQVHFDKYHLIYTPQEDSTKILMMEFYLPEDREHLYTIQVRPVWFDATIEDERPRSYVIGVEFIPPPDKEEAEKFEKKIAEYQKKGKHWWTAIFMKLWPNAPQPE